jgi:hypothetical protein
MQEDMSILECDSVQYCAMSWAKRWEKINFKMQGVLPKEAFSVW